MRADTRSPGRALVAVALAAASIALAVPAGAQVAQEPDTTQPDTTEPETTEPAEPEESGGSEPADTTGTSSSSGDSAPEPGGVPVAAWIGALALIVFAVFWAVHRTRSHDEHDDEVLEDEPDSDEGDDATLT